VPALRAGRMAVVPAATSRPGAMPAPKRISVLGATGSVGTSTLDLIGRTPNQFEVVALTAQTNVEALAECALRHRAAFAVIGDASRYQALKERLSGSGIEIAAGAAALIEAAARPADCVMAGISGAAGLGPTMAAVMQGRRVALANKECLVSAGAIFMKAVREAGTELVPVDSEHSGALQAIAGADPDFNRRDLWESIEAGAYPEFEFGVQIFSEEQAEAFSFDVLDATKIVPEELVPITPIGKMVLDRNPDYFFGETEQVAFCAAHIVPGIDFSNDPLLAGRLHSYQDTQLLRLGGPNFHEIPINASVSQVHNNTRDGFHRQSIHRGRVSYEPNSLAGGCPFQAGAAGFTSFPEPIHDDKVRGKPEKFADHYTQATLFWNSQTPIEKAHIIRAYRFELTKVQTTGVRERVVSMLANVATDLAEAVAAELGMEVPEPMPKALDNPQKPEIDASPRLSLFARPGDGSIRTRKIAILIADGVEGEAALALHEGLAELGAVPRFIAARLGQVQTPSGDPIDVEATLETTPSVLYDAVAIPDGEEAAETLAGLGQALEFIKDQYRHCKPILALGAGKTVLDAAEVPTELPAGGADPGVLALSDESSADALQKFVAAIAAHRHFERATDPPEV